MKRTGIKRVLIPAIILAVAFATLAVLLKTRPAAKTKPVKEQEWLVQAEPVNLTSASPSLILFGRVEAKNDSTLTAVVEADVAQLKVDEGHYVRKGDLLVVLDNREVQLQLEQRKAEVADLDAAIASEKQRYLTDQQLLKDEKEILALTEAALQRAQSLKEQELSSQSHVDEMKQARVRQSIAVRNREQAIADHPNRLAQLQAKRDQAFSRLQLARLDVDNTRIKAPFNGRIASVKVAKGERVRPGTALLDIYEIDELEMRAQVPANHLTAVQEAVKMDKQLSAQTSIDNQHYDLKLDRLSSKVDPGQGGVDAFLIFNKRDAFPQVGRVAEVLLQLPLQDNVLSIPREALYNTNRVYKIVENRLQAVTVDVLGEDRTLRSTGRLLIRSPALQNGDRILITKFANAIDGLRVTTQAATQ